MLEIRLLELELQRDGAPVPLPASKKSRALLGYLVATGKPQLRERLCDLLWDGPDDPRAALRWSLAKLRPLIGDALAAQRDRVAFQADGCAVDLLRIRDTSDLAAAASLFRGELLESLDLPSCYRFQQWLAGERESLRQHHLRILEQLVREHPLDDALPYARRRAVIDPFSEEAHAALIRLYVRLGRPHDALQQYEQCRVMFERELHAPPGAVVEDARRTIRRAAVPSAVAEPPRVRAGGTPPALLGRDQELATCLTATGVLLITGEPGIGKSRLLAELRDRKSPARYARAFAAEIVRPYGVWMDALGSELPYVDDRNAFFDAVADHLRDVALLAFDDLQWFDDASVALLSYVARNVKSVAIACTARRAELEENAAASHLVRERGITRIDLGPLSADDTRTLARSVAPSADVERIVADSGGNPLFTIELARAPASATLDALLTDRLLDLEPRARELVVWAAAVGRHFDIEILGRATGMPSGDMIAALESLERSAIITAAGAASGYDFTHDLLRHAAYQRLTGPRKWLVHRQIARALESTHDPDGSLAGEIAHHALIAGDHELATRASVAAGMRCLRLFAYDDALAVARRGLQAAESLPDPMRIELQMELLQVIVMLRTHGRERTQSEPRITALLDEAETRGMTLTASLGAHLLAVLAAEREDPRGAAAATLRSADFGRNADVATAAARLANTARCLIFLRRDVVQARAILTEAAALATQAKVEALEIPLALGYYFAHVGDDEAAIPQLERAREIAARDGDHWREFIAMSRLVQIALERRDIDAALRRCDALQPIAAKMSGGSEGPVSDSLRALAHCAAGDGSEVERSLATLRQIDSKGDLAYSLVYLAELALEQADRGAAHAYATEALAAADAVGRDNEAIQARCILAALSGSRAMLRPLITASKSPDITARARDCVRRTANKLKAKKEESHADDGRRTNV